MSRLLCLISLLLTADATVILGPKGSDGGEPAMAPKPEVSELTATARMTELLRSASPSVLLQQILQKRADPKEDKDLPVVHVGPRTDEEIKQLVDQERMLAWLQLRALAFAFVVYSCTVFCCAAIYAYLWKDPPVEVQAKEELSDDFQFGICNFFEDMHVTCLSFLCLPCRWADTMNATGMLGFWTAFSLFFVINILCWWAYRFDLTLGLVAWIAGTLVFAYYRQQLRKLFSIRNEPTDQVKDVALWACCCCCAGVQEARQVRAAGKLSEV